MIDVEQITRKNKLAKEMVKLGIVSNYEEASKRIDDESLVQGSNQEGRIYEKSSYSEPIVRQQEPIINKEISMPQMSGDVQESSQEGFNLLLKRVNMIEMQMSMIQDNSLKNNRQNDETVEELKQKMASLHNIINNMKKEWQVEPQQKIHIEEKPKVEEMPKNPRQPSTNDGFDPSVENIFNNSGNRLSRKPK